MQNLQEIIFFNIPLSTRDVRINWLRLYAVRKIKFLREKI